MYFSIACIVPFQLANCFYEEARPKEKHRLILPIDSMVNLIFFYTLWKKVDFFPISCKKLYSTLKMYTFKVNF